MSLSAFADTEIKPTQQPIDTWYEEKMAEETVSSTALMREITYQAQVKWEAEMNKVYKRLMQKLTKPQQNTLRNAQQQWLKFRNAEGKAILEIVSAQQGTIHPLSGTHRGMQLVRHRRLELISYEQEFEN
ncbi:lysozyme inhibitor LprI family protein [Methylophilus sp. TWE2]|uniref:lysozyme inhibitor LprI family protein n=1 Tax=Methylophilus sp. TWE2 TaxID=1662285 RepID=UPI001E2D14DE|nr:lysozyme inhibitor LprI family protein [Methylophilus sp. TWE2]